MMLPKRLSCSIVATASPIITEPATTRETDEQRDTAIAEQTGGAFGGWLRLGGRSGRALLDARSRSRPETSPRDPRARAVPAALRRQFPAQLAMNSSASGSRSRLRNGVGSKELNSSFKSETCTSISAQFGGKPSARRISHWLAQHTPPMLRFQQEGGPRQCGPPADHAAVNCTRRSASRFSGPSIATRINATPGATNDQ